MKDRRLAWPSPRASYELPGKPAPLSMIEIASRDLVPDPDQLNAAAMEHKLKRDAAAFQAGRRRKT